MEDTDDRLRSGIYTSSWTSFAAGTPRQMPSGEEHRLDLTQLVIPPGGDVLTQCKKLHEARRKRKEAKSRLAAARTAARRQSKMDAAAASNMKAVEDAGRCNM